MKRSRRKVLHALLLTLPIAAGAAAQDSAEDEAQLQRAAGQVARYLKQYDQWARDVVIDDVSEERDGHLPSARVDAQVSADAGLLAARVVTGQSPALQREAEPPFSFAALDLVRRAAAADKALPAEMHFPGQPQEHLALARVVSASGPGLAGEAAGSGPAVLWMAIDAKPIYAALRSLSIEGFADLRQVVAGDRHVNVVRHGDMAAVQGDALAEVNFHGTTLRAFYWPRAAAPQSSSGWQLPAAGVAAVLLLGGVGAMVVKRRRAAPAGPAESAPIAGPKKRPSYMEYGAAADGGTLPADRPPVSSTNTSAEDVGAPPPDEDESNDEESSVSSPAADGDRAALAPETIFRAYDIRGVVADALTPDTVRAIGRAIGSEAADRGQDTVVVARDGRLSGPQLKSALVEGLRSTGRNVVDVGCVPTPLLYFATNYLRTGTGVMVTGSHNPPEYNGLKMMIGGDTLFGDAITALRQRILDDNFVSAAPGTVSEVEIVEDYVRTVSEDIPVAFGRSFKVVVDCGNGVAGVMAPKLYRAIGHDVVELYCEVDGEFPNHHPDPSQPENLRDLIAAVAEHKADIGLAFDGDGDRLGVVDPKGNIIYPDRQMVLFARDVLKNRPGEEIIFDVKCSSRLPEEITAAGGKPLMWKTGHSFMKNKLKETNAPLAGEMSGHIFFNDRWFGFDDALYAGARLLELLTEAEGSPADVFATIPDGVSTPELKVDMAEGESLPFMTSLLERSDFGAGTVTTIDGLRVDFEDAWGLVRASNTTPSLVLRFEGNDKDALERVKSRFKEAMLAVDSNLQLPI